MAAGHHAEAEARYGEALAAAERVGDLELQGAFTQHLGILQRQTGRAATAVETLKQALRLFQQAGDRGGEMQTCDLLGSAEQVLDRLDPAEAWYRKALALAEAPGDGIEADQRQIGTTRQNLGILFQRRAQALPSDGDGPQRNQRERWLAAAIAEIAASLAIKQQMDNQLGAAASHGQLSQLHRLRGDLDRAEAEARQALAIYEPLDHPETWKVYASLADIARARGDAATADQWQAKAEAKRAEMQRRARGDDGDQGGDQGGDQRDHTGPTTIDPADPRHRELLQALTALAQAVYQARTQGQPLPPDAAEALAQLAKHPDPLPAYAAFLQAIAAGTDPAPPPLPEPLDAIAAELRAALP